MFWKKKKVLVTHNGGFHSDDIFACATIILLLEKRGEVYKIVRTREESKIQKADFVFDVGGVYDPMKNRFDHHQKGGAGVRENNVPMASFGLVWRAFGEEICGDKIVAEEIDRKFAQPIDANDNGMDVFKSNIPEVSPVTFQDIAGAFYPDPSSSDEEYDESFLKLVNLAKEILERSILKIQKQQEVNSYMKSLYESGPEKRFIVVDRKYSRHEVTVGAIYLEELLYVIYPSKPGDEWNIVATRKNIESMESKKPFPGEWAGLSGFDLQKVSKVMTAKFCHNGRFLCVAEKLEDAKELATLAIKG
ncbi:MAG: hypothetical protein QG580_319 [Patescibacteria group bacterium]|jgi:uncharacterized UPF0160 family protein|nr:hypothetical protein [Patescibacteria group bacterium]